MLEGVTGLKGDAIQAVRKPLLGIDRCSLYDACRSELRKLLDVPPSSGSTGRWLRCISGSTWFSRPFSFQRMPLRSIDP